MSDIRARYEPETDGVADKQLLALLQTMVERAKSFGLRADRDIVAFMELTFVFGHEYDHSQRILDILTRNDMLVQEQEDTVLPSEAPYEKVPNPHDGPESLQEEL